VKEKPLERKNNETLTESRILKKKSKLKMPGKFFVLKTSENEETPPCFLWKLVLYS